VPKDEFHTLAIISGIALDNKEKLQAFV